MADAVSIAMGYVGTRAGQPAVARFLAFVGLRPPLAWCLAFALFAAHAARPSNPYPRYAKCSLFWAHVTANPFRFKTFTPSDVSWGLARPERNDIAIFRHGAASMTNWSGHAATVIRALDRGRVQTIEGNTSPDARGNQRMGGVVAVKTRQAGIAGFELQGFVRPIPGV